MSVNCPATAGSQGQCGAGSNGMGIFSILVSNNNNGSYTDSNGTTYANCNDLLAAYGGGSLVSVAGIYISNTSVAGDTVVCNGTNCTMVSPECYSGWDSSTASPSGVAILPTGSPYLACTYIDTTPIGINLLITADSPWAAGFSSLTAGGTVNFTNWVDSQ